MDSVNFRPMSTGHSVRAGKRLSSPKLVGSISRSETRANRDVDANPVELIRTEADTAPKSPNLSSEQPADCG